MKKPSLGDRRALADRIVRRLLRDYEYLSANDQHEMTNIVAEELDEYFGPVKKQKGAVCQKKPEQ